MKYLKSFISIIVSQAVVLAAWGQIYIESTELEPAITEYISQTIEASSLGAHLHDGESVYLMGGSVTRIALAVKNEINRLNSGLGLEGLPVSINDLLSFTQDYDLLLNTDYRRASNFLSQTQVSGIVKEGQDWSIATLRKDNNRGIVDDETYLHQNTDLYSLGILRLAKKGKQPNSKDDVSVLPARRSESGESFLEAIESGTNKYLNSDKHSQTFLARKHRNPKMVSAIKYVVNNQRFGSNLDKKSMRTAKKIISDFSKKDFHVSPETAYVLSRIHYIVTKSIYEVKDLDKAVSAYTDLGIIDILHKVEGIPEFKGSLKYKSFDKAVRRLKAKSKLASCKAALK